MIRLKDLITFEGLSLMLFNTEALFSGVRSYATARDACQIPEYFSTIKRFSGRVY